MKTYFDRIDYKIISRPQQATICAGQTIVNWVCAEYHKENGNDSSQFKSLPSGCQ
ncbi:hypothetical protein M0D21_00190 [Aquimarina sp. D1M17]|uniref:hypothetical protein n=1 Tax=Aquimarina acroporae TaxID=2937283 RepID=UPI0020C0DF92|nr:hypothetical protein [Aquimarina acroporae]MCK8519967.1 hypothetical protein [Aquimarina acroporae]